MNNDDLERQLRAQAGPREAGYQPAVLPATIEGEPSRPSRTLRLAVLVPAALAGVAVVLVAGLLLSQNAPRGVGSGVSPTITPSVQPTASESGPTACLPSHPMIWADPWGGAAGSRGTVVYIRVPDGPPCQASVEVTARVTDRNGATVVVGRPGDGRALSGKVEVLELGKTFGITVLWSNWCGDEPASPLRLSIRLAGWTDFVPVTVAAGGIDPVPPCNGGNETVFSVSDLQPVP